MKVLGHILILFVLFCSLKAFGAAPLLEQLAGGPIEVVVDEEQGTISLNDYKVDSRFLVEKKSFVKGGEDYKTPIVMLVHNNKLIIDLNHVQRLTFKSGNVLNVSGLVDFILEGGQGTQNQGGGPTGTHGGGK